MKTAVIALSILLAGALIGGAFLLVRDDGGANTQVASANNVSIVDGKQIIEIRAKGGYLPRASVAKAGIPTVIRMSTSNTFDCSSAVRIPSMGIFKSLPQTGVTDIDLGSPAVATLRGSCGMGMYPFQIDFQS